MKLDVTKVISCSSCFMEITIDFDDDEDLDGTSCGLYLVSVSH